MSYLSLSNVFKSYGGTQVLAGVSLDIAAGEVHALMGENGAGKSTLIKIMAGVEPADRMDVVVGDRPVSINGTKDAHALGFRFIHQELNVVPQMSVAENIILGQPYPRRAGLAVGWRDLNAMAKDALSRLGISHIDPSRKAARLSTGDQMLMKIAGTLVAAPGAVPARLYVMDEPTAALTGEESEKLFAVIAELKKSGAAILYVSHRMDEVMRICDRITVLRDGQNVSTRLVAETSKDEIIQDMTGRDVHDTYPERQSEIGDAVLCAMEDVSTATLKNIDFQLRAGEILGLAGLAGSGQSEVLQTLLGVSSVQSGTLRFAGDIIDRLDPARAWSMGISYVPRERRREGLMLSSSVLENVVLSHLGKLSRFGRVLDHRRNKDHANQLAQFVRLKAEGPGQVVRKLSGGNQQKVVFARALGDAPRLLLLDEPTRGVDVGAKFDIYTLVRDLSAQGCAVVLASSDLPELIGLCDRILILADGRQREIVSATNLAVADLLARFYHDGAASTGNERDHAFETIRYLARASGHRRVLLDTASRNFHDAAQYPQRVPADLDAGGCRLHHDRGHGHE